MTAATESSTQPIATPVTPSLVPGGQEKQKTGAQTAPGTHPQGRDGGGIPEPALLIFQIVTFGPLITLADFPQLHSFICGGQPEETKLQ